MWCRPHPRNPDRYLVLLDTEGLSDPNKGDNKHDMAIFSLAVLLSSCFLYNSIGTINQQAIEQLHLVSKLTEHIKVKSFAGSESGEDFDKYFPSFIWVVRDFTLEKTIGCKEVTSDEYLEKCLELKKGRSREIQDYNSTRATLKDFFKSRRCYTMPRPCAEHKLKRVEELDDSEINPEFLQTTNKLIEFILEKTEVKTVSNQLITGSVLGGLTESYIDSISKGGIPCIESAVRIMSDVECKKAVEIGIKRYLKHIDENLAMPTSLKNFSAIHGQALKHALRLYMDIALFDDECIYQQQLQTRVDEHYERLGKQNIEISKKKCEEFLKNAYEPIKKQLLKGSFLRSGGYEAYLIVREKVKNLYDENCKWFGADEVYESFAKEKIPEQMQIMKADKRLSDSQKLLAESDAKLEMEKMRAKAKEEDYQKQIEQAEDTKKTMEAHVLETEKKHEMELERFKKEHNCLMENTLKNREELLRKGFTEEAALYQEKLEELQKEYQDREEEHKAEMAELKEVLADQIKKVNFLIEEGKGFFTRAGNWLDRKLFYLFRRKDEIPEKEDDAPENGS